MGTQITQGLSQKQVSKYITLISIFETIAVVKIYFYGLFSQPLM